MNFEQFLGSWETASKMIFSENTKLYQKHFSWGNEFKDLLIKNDVVEKNIFITGRPIDAIINKEYLKNRKKNKKIK